MGKERFPLHPAQLDVFLDQLVNQDSPHYNTGGYIRLTGQLDKQKFIAAINSVPIVFDAFKMRFDITSGEPGFYLDEDYTCFEVDEMDLSENPSPASVAAKWIQDDFNIPFDLHRDTVFFKQVLIKISEQEYWTYHKFHHLVVDGHGFAIWAQYIAEKYKSLIADDGKVFIYPSYVKEAARAVEYYHSPGYKSDEQYWVDKLKVMPRKPIQPSGKYNKAEQVKSRKYALILEEEQKKSIEELQLLCNCNLQQLTIAALTIYLSKTTDVSDFVFGIPIHKRRSRTLRNMLGMFSGFLPFRISQEEAEGLLPFLKRIKNLQQRDYRYQDFVIGDLFRNAANFSETERPFDIVINYELLNFKLDFGNDINAITNHVLSEYEKIPLHICWRDFGKQQPLALHIDFLSEYFDQQDIEMLGERLLYMLDQFRTHLEEPVKSIDIIPVTERQRLTEVFNDTAVSYPKDMRLTDLLNRQAQLTPGAIAVIGEDAQLTYKELSDRSSQLAHYIQKTGIEDKSIIAICMEPGINMIVGILGIIKAGFAYLPVDPAYPADRIHYMLEDANVQHIISNSGIQSFASLPGKYTMLFIDQDAWTKEPVKPPAITITQDHLLYVIYTSGSTGRPKGAGVFHRSEMNLLYWYIDEFSINSTDRNIIISSLGFDLTQKNIFSTLCTGGALVLPAMDYFDVSKLSELIAQHSVTIINCTPSAFYPFAEDNDYYEKITSLRLVILGGEPIQMSFLDKWISDAGSHCEIVNSYGPTECTDIASFYRVKTPLDFMDKPIPLGKPNSNVQLFVLNDKNELQPEGIPGKICICGESVGIGYINDPLLTSEKFIPNPFGSGRLYQTGDMGKWLHDGNLLYMGRMDEQVKIRGFRIEPGEVETVLKKSGLISQVVVLAKEVNNSNKELAAFIVPNQYFNHTSIIRYSEQELPAYMIPAFWVELDKIPLTANGKVDKISLAAIEIVGTDADRKEMPSSELESMLLEIWIQLLNNEHIDINSNFFASGGNSLLATRLVSQVKKRLGVELMIKDLFECNTIARLAERFDYFRNKGTQPVIQVSERPSEIPLSFEQERLWFIDTLSGSVPYHLPVAFRLSGKPDRDALEASFRQIINRHEVLRTFFEEREGKVYQYVMEKATWNMSIYEMPSYATPSDIDERLEVFVAAPFNLSKDSPLRAELIQLPDQTCLLLIKLHHIASDGWSVAVFFRELTEGYNASVENRTPVLASLNIQYADYALWQQAYLKGPYIDGKLEFLYNKLAGAVSLDLPIDFPRPAIQSTKGAVIQFLIDEPLKDQVTALCRKEGVTVFMTLLSAFYVLMYRYTGQQDIAIGTPVSNRNEDGLNELIGFFVNMLALRMPVNGDDSFGTLLKQTRQTLLEAYEYQDVPFEKVVNRVVKERDLSRNPLIQVVFAFQQDDVLDIDPKSLTGLSLSKEHLAVKTAKFELTFTLTEKENGLLGEIEYCTDLYNENTVQRMAVHYKHLLSALISNPGQKIGSATMLLPEEEDQLIHHFNDTAVEFPLDQTVVALFEAQVIKAPDNIAVVFQERSIDYKELNILANEFCDYLQQKFNIKPNDIVALKLEKSEWMMISILAVLKSGAAYLPLDPSHPLERINFMIEESKCVALIDTHVLADFQDRKNSIVFNRTNVALISKPEDLAYVIFTSGSTGRPKGVLIQHKALTNLCCWHQQQFSVTAHDRATLYANMVFDASVWEFFPYIISGACLYLIPADIQLDAAALATFYDQYQISIGFLPTPIGEQFINYDSNSLRYLLVGGDKLNQYIERNYQVVNNYGPTENTVVTTSFMVDRRYSNIPIGKPVSNVQIYILNEQQAICPVGIRGALCIAGASLAAGYINNTALTAEKFVPNPFGGDSLLYKTGDMARWLPDGNIEFLGRVDDQVKIRGYRIEVGEIEQCLHHHPAISAAVVMPLSAPEVDKKLVAYIIANTDLELSAIRNYLGTMLPAYMLPNYFVQVSEFPYTSSGKIDREQLLKTKGVVVQAGVDYVAASNKTEETLVRIWQDLLGVERISVLDNFFDLGGHSIMATRMIWAIRKELQAEITIGDLFRQPTILGISASLNMPHIQLPLHTLEQQQKPAFIPLSFAQERIWILDQVKGSIQYHISAALRLSGSLEPEFLKQALQSIVNRHEVLRTVIRQEAIKPYQFIMPENRWEFTQPGSLDNIPFNDPDSLTKYIRMLVELPFDLANDHMLRATLIKIAEDEHVLVIVLHHIASDGWSMPIIIKEIAAFYEAIIFQQDTGLLPLPIQYADFAIWQRNHMEGKVLVEKMNYWSNKLSNISHLNLPTNFARPSILSYQGAVVQHVLSPELRKPLQQLSREQGVTLFITMLAAYKLLLYRYSGQNDICVGSPTADRIYESCDTLVGLFMNSVALRTSISPQESFINLLGNVKQTALEAYEHRDFPFEKIVQEVAKERDLSRTPVFQVMFAMENEEDIKISSDFLKGLITTYEKIPVTTTTFEIILTVFETAEGMSVQAAYSTDLYTEDTIQRLLGHYEQVLKSIAANPHQLIDQMQLLTEFEKHQLLVQFNNTARPVPTGLSLPDLIEKQVSLSPDRIAIICRSASITYVELNERSNRLAHFLRRKGIKEQTLIPVCLNRNIDLVVAILAILKAGCAYVPVDPEYPADRISFLFEDSNAAFVLGSTGTKEKIQGNFEVLLIDENAPQLLLESAENPVRFLDENALAYVIYTSGSTGKPKGVQIMHRNLINFLTWIDDLFDGAQHNMLASTSVCFDISIIEIFFPLVTGGKMTMVNSVMDYVTDDNAKAITFFNSVPSSLKILLTKGSVSPAVKVISLGGDALRLSVIKECFIAGYKGSVYHWYGPTETTVYSTGTWLYPDDKQIHIGYPIYNTGIYILNEYLQLQPIGVPGEIFIGGKGVATGYLNRPALNEERFIKDPFQPDATIYRTGDIGVWQPDGSIVWLTRIDNQIKVKGFRIELGEIELALNSHPDISEAVVLAVDDLHGEKQLDAYIVTKKTLHLFDLREYLGEILPAYMMPANFISIDEVPVTPNGKTDRKKLNRNKGEMLLRQVEYMAPDNSTEKEMIEIWQKVLEVEYIGVNDNFFDLGGSSVKAIEMVSLVNKSLDISIEVLTAFKYPTLKDFTTQVLLMQKPALPLITDSDEEMDVTINLMKQTINLLNYEHDDN
jgi:amino acid adenylation domain-containing protein